MPKHVARKRFGQNFLVDRSVIERIVQQIAPKATDTLVEIGPGQGALTEPLLASNAMLRALEIDRDLAAELERRFGQRTNFNLLVADALKFDLNSIDMAERYRVVGNLPYNISTPLLFHLLRYRLRIEDMVFMLQSEVVDRLVASPGGKDYGRLSVMMQYHCDVSRLMSVPPSAFRPAPKVMSAIVRLAPKALVNKESRDNSAQVENELAEKLQVVVKAAFSSRRKTLRNNLRGMLSEAQIEQCDIDPGLRAEKIGLEQFVRLAESLVLPEVCTEKNSTQPGAG